MRLQAFTLIELLVVIAIIAVLAAILFPVFAQAKAASKKAHCLSNVRQMAVGLMLYGSDYDGGYPNNGDPYLWVGKRMRWPLMPYLGVGQREGEDFNSVGKSPQILICPSDATASATFDATSYAMSATLYLPGAQIDQMRIRNLIPSVNDPLLAPITNSDAQVEWPAQKIGFSEWLNSHRHDRSPVGFWGTVQAGIAPGPDRWSGGRNVAFLDGHASFVFANRQTPSAQDAPDMNLTPGGISGRDLR